MKTFQRGFIIPLLLVIIAVLVVGGGIYIYTITIINTQQPTIKLICSFSGNTIDDGQYQNGLTFVAQGENCATLSGWAPNNPTNQSLTFNGVTKTWRYVLLSFYQANFSPDGKHFAYTASNVPLPAPNPGGDWKPQRFVVSDNVAGSTYDDVYYPQYSQDGKHFGYCAYQNGQYLKIIDGIATATTKGDYFDSCGSLFGYSVKGNEGLGVGADVFSNDKSIEIKTYFDPKIAGSVSCSMAECPIYISVTKNGVAKIYGPYSDVASSVAFSSDNKHFAWTLGGQLFVDGISSGQKYNEAFNLSFLTGNNYITYNARSGKSVYFISEPIK